MAVYTYRFRPGQTEGTIQVDSRALRIQLACDPGMAAATETVPLSHIAGINRFGASVFIATDDRKERQFPMRDEKAARALIDELNSLLP